MHEEQGEAIGGPLMQNSQAFEGLKTMFLHFMLNYGGVEKANPGGCYRTQSLNYTILVLFNDLLR